MCSETRGPRRMTLYDLKPAFQDLLRPACRALARAGVTANQVTVAAMVLSVLTGAAVMFLHDDSRFLLIVPVVLLLRMALNAVDGLLAREHGMKSALGGLLNELGDVISDVALYLPFAMVDGLSPVAVVATVVFAVLTEITGVVAVQIGACRRYDGPMGKSDRAFAFGLLAALLGVGVDAGPWANGGLWLVAILSVTTVVNRARAALGESHQAG